MKSLNKLSNSRDVCNSMNKSENFDAKPLRCFFKRHSIKFFDLNPKQVE